MPRKAKARKNMEKKIRFERAPKAHVYLCMSQGQSNCFLLFAFCLLLLSIGSHMAKLKRTASPFFFFFFFFFCFCFCFCFFFLSSLHSFLWQLPDSTPSFLCWPTSVAAMAKLTHVISVVSDDANAKRSGRNGADHNDEGFSAECRICHEEEEDLVNLERPCACSGSIQVCTLPPHFFFFFFFFFMRALSIKSFVSINVCFFFQWRNLFCVFCSGVF